MFHSAAMNSYHIFEVLEYRSIYNKGIRLHSPTKIQTCRQKKKVHPTFGVRPQLQEPLSQKCTGLPLSPQRARVTRASAVFRFLPSPLHHTTVRNYGTATCGWRLHTYFLHRWRQKKDISFTFKTHCINELRVKVKGEGKNCELAEGAMRRGVSVRAYGGADEETGRDMVGEGTGVFSKKAGRKKRKEGTFRKKVHKFLFNLSPFSKIETFFSQNLR